MENQLQYEDPEESLALIEANELTDEQYAKFLDEVEKLPTPRAPLDGKTARLAFEFMEDTGCRVTETINVRKRDLDFRTNILTVTRPKTETKCKCSTWIYKDQFTRRKVLQSADPKCEKCHGKGKYKKPQRTTFTPRLVSALKAYAEILKDDELLFPITRQSLWRWGKRAGKTAGIRIFQQKQDRMIEGIFLHLFRALCSKRTTADAKDDKYKDALVRIKMRHSYQVVTDRYTEVTLGYLISWERKIYGERAHAPNAPITPLFNER